VLLHESFLSKNPYTVALLQRTRQKMLDGADKQIRVAIARTDIDSILAELKDRNITSPTPEQLAEKNSGKDIYGSRRNVVTGCRLQVPTADLEAGLPKKQPSCY